MKIGVLGRGTLIVAALSASCVAIANVRSQADTLVRETQVSYIVDHEDTTREKVVVKYEAFLQHKVWQTGSASKPLSGKIKDDRACHYTVNARLFRRAYIASHSGILAPVEEYQAIYDANQGGSRGPDNTFEALSYHKTCGDVDLFKGRIAGARAKLVAQFDVLVAKDDDKARERLKTMLVASKISEIKEE